MQQDQKINRQQKRGFLRNWKWECHDGFPIPTHNARARFLVEKFTLWAFSWCTICRMKYMYHSQNIYIWQHYLIEGTMTLPIIRHWPVDYSALKHVCMYVCDSHWVNVCVQWKYDSPWIYSRPGLIIFLNILKANQTYLLLEPAWFFCR